ATCGVAWLVPLTTSVRALHLRKRGGCSGAAGSGELDKMSTPGPAMSTRPSALTAPQEKFAMRMKRSSAATAMIDGLFAGLLTGAITPDRRSLSFPAAATISAFRTSAACAACSKATEKVPPTGTGEPRDIETTWQLFRNAHSIPARVERPRAEP